MRAKIVFSPEARNDLIGLYEYIADQASPQRALAYIDRIEAYCLAFADFPEGERNATTSDRACERSASRAA